MKKDAWKDDMMNAQQEMLRKRRETGGFLSEEERMEISERRQESAREAKALNELQKRNAAGEDTLEDWKKMRETGESTCAPSDYRRIIPSP